jgi:hypothetical protein
MPIQDNSLDPEESSDSGRSRYSGTDFLSGALDCPRIARSALSGSLFTLFEANRSYRQIRPTFREPTAVIVEHSDFC